MKKVGVDDYLLKHSVDELLHLPRVNSNAPTFEDIKMAHKKWKQKKSTALATENLPEIDVSDPHLPNVVSRIWKVIRAANEEKPSLFRYGNSMCRIEEDDRSVPVIQVLDEDQCLLTISHLARFVIFKTSRNQTFQVQVTPPKHIVKAVLATPNKPLPILKRIVATPVFGPDGTIQTELGYSESSQTFYAPAKGLKNLKLSKTPSKKEIERAKNLLLNDLLGDFPFAKASDCAHALVLLLSIPARALIEGPVPLISFTAPSQGTGKGLLCEVGAFIFTESIIKITETKDENEWRKRLLAAFRNSPVFILLDNVKNRLESSALESALTSDYFSERILGFSQMSSFPIQCVWAATGNNITFGSEMARRTILVGLNAKTERPWQKSDFRHPELRDWAKKHRGKLLWAALTLVQAWIAAGKPSGKETLGSFEKWARVMGGILEVIGVQGFLGNLTNFYEEADQERLSCIPFIRAWYKAHSNRRASVGQLLSIAQDTLDDLEGTSIRSQQTKLGQFLGKIKDRIFEGLTVKKCPHRSGISMWRLVPREGDVREPSTASDKKKKFIILKARQGSPKVPRSSGWKKAVAMSGQFRRRA